MRRVFIVTISLSLLTSCLSDKKGENITTDFIIAFGSCNNQRLENILWDDILAQNPDLWIWGGDVVYADTEDMNKLKTEYKIQLENPGYKKLAENVEVMGTWDDHDYGLNDGGEHFAVKYKSQQEFLDFLGVSSESKRREQEGVYFAKVFETRQGSIKIMILDTRFFRSDLTLSVNRDKRYQPNSYGQGTVLGEKQWEWLEDELKSSSADFNVIVSSIQVLSDKHGFETWGNFPHEVDKFKELIVDSRAKGVIVLSGDRHISEFSQEKVKGIAYPLIDFTSSGLTHSYSGFSGEENPYRKGFVISDLSFGLLDFNFESKEVVMKMIGDNGQVQQEIKQSY